MRYKQSKTQKGNINNCVRIRGESFCVFYVDVVMFQQCYDDCVDEFFVEHDEEVCGSDDTTYPNWKLDPGFSECEYTCSYQFDVPTLSVYTKYRGPCKGAFEIQVLSSLCIVSIR